MYVSTKSIVTEIRVEQETLKKEIEGYDAEHREVLSEIKEMLSEMAHNVLDIQDRLSNDHRIFMERISNLEKQVSELQKQFICCEEDLKSGYQTSATSIKEDISQSLIRQRELTGEKLQEEASVLQQEIDRVHSELKGQIEKTSDLIVTSTGTISELISVKSDTIIRDVSNKSHSDSEELASRIETTIHSWGEHVEKDSIKLNDKLDNTRDAIQLLKNDLLSNRELIETNIETMNHGIQEALRNLMSLDEANRLIIAKLLLKDLVV